MARPYIITNADALRCVPTKEGEHQQVGTLRAASENKTKMKKQPSKESVGPKWLSLNAISWHFWLIFIIQKNQEMKKATLYDA